MVMMGCITGLLAGWCVVCDMVMMGCITGLLAGSGHVVC